MKVLVFFARNFLFIIIYCFSYFTVQNMQMLPANLRQTAAHSVPCIGHSLCGRWLSGRFGFAQSQRAANCQFLLTSQLDRTGHHGTFRHTGTFVSCTCGLEIVTQHTRFWIQQHLLFNCTEGEMNKYKVVIC